jgi:hypothetical protein
MIKQKYLYHGSRHKIAGKLRPKKCLGDFGDNPDEKLQAVYATDRRGLAIGYAIISSKGIELSGLDDKRKRPPYVNVSIGWPKDMNSKLYIYKFSSVGFKRVRGEKHEYFSLEPVKPLSCEVVKLKDYIHYAKKAKDWRIKSTTTDKITVARKWLANLKL